MARPEHVVYHVGLGLRHPRPDTDPNDFNQSWRHAAARHEGGVDISTSLQGDIDVARINWPARSKTV